MKTFVGLCAVLAAGTLAAGTLALSQAALTPAFAQTMGPPPATSAAGEGTSVPMASRNMLSRDLDAYFSVPMPAASADAKSPAPAAPGKLVSYSSAHVDGPYIAITFDDGPNPETTPKLLKMLKQRGIHATFFVLGSRASQNPEILREMVADGHEIGNHSWSHPQLPKIGTAKADQEIATTSDAIEKATGQRPIYLRPPYGEMTPALRDHIRQKYGLTFIYWSVDTLDWKYRKADSIYDKAMKQVGRGGIILAHDIHATTVAAMPRLLDALLAKGYKFVTISELIAMDKPEAKAVAALTPTPPKKPKAVGGTGSNTKSSKSSTKPKPASAKPSTPKPVPVSASARSSGGLY